MSSNKTINRIEEYINVLNEFPHDFIKEHYNVEILNKTEDIKLVEQNISKQYVDKGWDSKWAEVGLHYEDPYMQVFRDALTFENGRSTIHHRIVWKSGEISGVVMLPRYKNKYVLVSHYRHPIMHSSLECPRGGTSVGKDIDYTIKQELSEEIGASTSSYYKLGYVFPTNNLINAGVNLYLVEINTLGKPEKNEGILEIHLFTSSEIEKNIKDGYINDASTICAFTQAKLKGFIK